MSNDKKMATFDLRVAEIQEIAKGIFDDADRQKLLRFVADSKKMAHAMAAQSPKKSVHRSRSRAS